MAHPEKEDFQNLLNGPYNKTADKVICGVAIMTGPAFAEETDYSRKPSKKFVEYYKGMLAAGYHLGPTVDHDNHFLTFGRMTSSRTVVLAMNLNHKSITSAYQEMRFYATTDWNVKVDFKINGFPMGKMMNTKTPSKISIKVTDPDLNDDLAAIKVMHGRPGSREAATVLTKSDTETFDFTHDIPKGQEYYYYLEITQNDGDKIYTSPIWVRRLK